MIMVQLHKVTKLIGSDSDGWSVSYECVEDGSNTIRTKTKEYSTDQIRSRPELLRLVIDFVRSGAGRRIDTDSRRRLTASNLPVGWSLIASSIGVGRNSGPSSAMSYASAAVECERQNDYGGLHSQAVRGFTDHSPTVWVGTVLHYILPDGSTTDDRSEAIRRWSVVVECQTVNAEGESVVDYCYR